MTPALSRSDQVLAERSTEAATAQASEKAIAAHSISETRILLRGISWETYQRLLKETGETRKQRFAYCDGALEIMVPLPDHEEPTRLFDDFVAVFVDALDLELRKLGSMTMEAEAKKRGLEPDCCFYIQNEAAVRGLSKLDFEVHPPPDLVVEVDNSSGSLNKFPIYSALRVPEIWRLRQGILEIYVLNSARTAYETKEQSLTFPQLPVPELPQFIERAKVAGQRSAVRELKKRVQSMLEK